MYTGLKLTATTLTVKTVISISIEEEDCTSNCHRHQNQTAPTGHSAATSAIFSLTIWRDGAERTVALPTVALDGRDVDRVLVWAGATLQSPHRAMAVQRNIEPTGVFIAFFMYGSPAARYKLWAGRRITEVDGIPVADLDAFIRAVSGRPDGSSVRSRP